jgi:hypothetical protein
MKRETSWHLLPGMQPGLSFFESRYSTAPGSQTLMIAAAFFYRDLRKQLFGRYKRRERSRSREKRRSRSPGFRGNDRDRGPRGRSPDRRGNRDRERGGSAERRARIASWRQERAPPAEAPPAYGQPQYGAYPPPPMQGGYPAPPGAGYPGMPQYPQYPYPPQ